MPEFLEALKIYGPLGVVSGLSLWANIKQYKDKARLEKDHKADIKDLYERHVTKHEKMLEKNHELAENLRRLLEYFMAGKKG